MNVRTLCLSILASGDMSGYDIRKLVADGKYCHFVDASFGAIYPALNRLEQDGSVTRRQEVQPGKPPRNVYAITDPGRTELVEALSQPQNKDIFRSEFLLIAMYAELLPRSVIEAAIARREQQLSDEIGLIREIVGETDHPGTHWVGEYGITCLGRSLSHLRETKDALLELAATARDHGVAAPDAATPEPAEAAE
ncbi:MAG: PadR family transcriptional regulator [Pseudomonadota bacterium]